MNNNIILNVDSYKTSHYLQYPPGAEVISSYIESRGGAYPETVFFGLQMFIKQFLSRPITASNITDARTVITAHGLPFNEEGWQYILNQHGGFLPIEIQAVPEGLRVPVNNVLVQVKNTDERCPWLTSYLETSLLRAIWYPTTVATRSFACREIIRQSLLETADSEDGLEFKLHDFGARGASSAETAAIGGAAHLLNFSGTDTLAGVMALREYYGAQMPGFSIPAAEHSTITCWGEDNEATAYANMIEQFSRPGSLFAVVSDSYDLFHAIDKLWGTQLREQVIHRGGTLVVRPDSGNPCDIVPQTIEALIAKFGSSVNRMGYRVLPDYLRVIQGDGVSPEMIKRILDELKSRHISAENVAFGMGGELLQNVNRDTLSFAMKASAIRVNGTWKDVYKSPATDPSKRSKRGRLQLVQDRQHYFTQRETPQGESLLQTVYRNGRLVRQTTFDEIRARLHAEAASKGEAA
ncbi:MAG: nicotinate phosphoribosyltransferase [Gammaproteobacteria bacterium]|nr:nicotinate phosphoribosyltransferase [Gammaproteobacteria bacterium]